MQFQDNTEFSNYQTELKFLLEDDKRLTSICHLLEKIKDTGNTLILVDRVSAGKEIQTRLSEAFTKDKLDYEVSFVSGETNLTERKEQYDEVATATNKVIVATYGVAAVGINIPRIFNLVLVEPGKSFVRVIQSIGRGIRKAEDKDFVQIWDLTSSCKYAKRHLTQRKAFYKEANYPFSLEKIKYK
jgi:superfamily II DNA or RNA helicase